jgi:hypothetical protein
MEAGSHSIWISQQLQEMGHEVLVANALELRAISHSDRKSDQGGRGEVGSLCKARSKDPQADYSSDRRAVEGTHVDPSPQPDRPATNVSSERSARAS